MNSKQRLHRIKSTLGALGVGAGIIEAIEAYVQERIAEHTSKQATDLELLAEHLHARDGAPSLKGYIIGDGLAAASEMIGGGQGPIIHDDITRETRDMELKDLPRLTCAEMLKKLKP